MLVNHNGGHGIFHARTTVALTALQGKEQKISNLLETQLQVLFVFQC